MIYTARKRSSPAIEEYNDHIYNLRQSEYPQLHNTTYLDHAGTTLYANSLIDAVSLDLKSNLFGNPYSASPSSNLSSLRIDDVRSAFLQYLNADPEHFDVIFTANATAAIKLVVNGFQEHTFRYYYHKDAHSSLVGIRELASAGSRCFTSDEEVEECLTASNMTGYRPPLSWGGRLRKREDGTQGTTYSLLDASPYLTTGRLDLSDPSTAPDFIVLSFYKIFGFPDLGALIVRKEAGDILTCRKYFGGRTVDMVIDIGDQWHAMKEPLHEVLEDGAKMFFGNAAQISQHVSTLSASLYQTLNSLQHWNNVPVAQVYKDVHATYGDATTQGPIIAFNVQRADVKWVRKSHFETLAIACDIQMRSGGVCNPGGIATMLELEPWKMRRNYCEGMRCGDDLDVLGGQPTGVLRVSFGALSTQQDIYRFTQFVEYFFVESVSEVSPILEKPDLRTEITPIEGCSPVSLPQLEGRSQQEVSDAWSLFHDQWCIIDLDPLQPIAPQSKLKIALQTLLTPEDGSLTFRQDHEERPDDSYFAMEPLTSPQRAKVQYGLLTPSQCQSTSVKIDLWKPPPEKKSAIPGRSGRIADPYQDPEIAEFISCIAGRPCTLARYRPTLAKHIGLNCEIATCRVELAKKEVLKQHYEQHAKMFLESDLEMRAIHLQTVEKQPSSTAKTLNVASRNIWASCHTAFRRRAGGCRRRA